MPNSQRTAWFAILAAFRDTCQLWNRAAETVPGWPQLRVAVPVRRIDFALTIDAFPASFREDVERFLTQAADPDVFSESYRRPARPLTIRNRRQNILMAATALVRSGVPAAQITGLDVLVDPDNTTAALRFLYDRAGGRSTGHLHQIAILLKTIARHHAGADVRSVDRLKALCRGLKPPSGGLTEKNKACLRQFADAAKLVALLMLPQRVLNDIKRGDRRRDAVRAALALAVGIELIIPLRIHNLAGLRLDRHIHRVGERVFLAIAAEETKNDNPIEAELPAHLARQLTVYLERHRPRLFAGSSPFLFPGEAGACRRSGGFGGQISAFLAKEAGVVMTVHQFRHLAAKLFLDEHPDGSETVRRLLGHKSLETTTRFYRELDSVVASRRYNAFLDRKVAAAQIATAPRRGRRR